MSEGSQIYLVGGHICLVGGHICPVGGHIYPVSGHLMAAQTNMVTCADKYGYLLETTWLPLDKNG